MRARRYLLPGTLALGAFSAFFVHQTAAKPKAAGNVTARVDDLAGIVLADAPSQDQLNQYARRVVAQLTKGSEPAWERPNDWQTKTELSGGAQAGVNKGVKLVRPSKAPLQSQRLLSALATPVQTASMDKNGSTRRLDQVFYNSTAAARIRQIGGLTFPGQSLAPFPAGSIAVKAIWSKADMSAAEPALPASTIYSSMPSTATGISAHGARVIQQQAPGALRKLEPPFAQPATRQGWREIKLSYNPANPDPPCQPSNDDPQVEQRTCLYSFVLAKDPGSVAPGSVQGIQCEDTCVLGLLGLNLMVKAHEGTDWIWIALWWTGTHHNYQEMDQKSPWQYYEIGVSDKDRDFDPGHPANILFNPFLEGTQDNGTVANCKTCHQYAAVDPRNRSQTLRSCGTGLTLGGLPLPPNATASEVQNVCGSYSSPESYLKHYLTTDSLWSLAEATTAPNSHAGVSRQNARVEARR